VHLAETQRSTDTVARTYAMLLAGAAALVFYSNLPLFLNDVLFPFYYWIYIFVFAVIPICHPRDLVRVFSRVPFLKWCMAYVLLSCTCALYSDNPVRELTIRFGATVSLLLFYRLFSLERSMSAARYIILVVAALSVVLNIYEYANPCTFSTVWGRAAGLYQNPTISGTALTLGMIISIGLLGEAWRPIFSMFIGLGVMLTVSRGPIFMWVFTNLMLIIGGVITFSRRSLMYLLLIVSVIGVIAFWRGDYVYAVLEDRQAVTSDARKRLEQLLFGANLDDESASGRFWAAEAAWRNVLKSPFMGNGLGSCKQWNWQYDISSHNQYLNHMSDHGLLGILILPTLLMSLVWGANGHAREIRAAFIVFMLVMGLVSHNVLEELYILLICAMVMAMTVKSWSEKSAQERKMAL